MPKKVNTTEETQQIEKDIATADNASQLIAAARSSSQWEFINEHSQRFFGKTFTYASEFKDSLACISENGKYDPEKNVLNVATYHPMDTNGLADKNIISDEPFQLSEGRAIISQDGLKVIIDKSG